MSRRVLVPLIVLVALLASAAPASARIVNFVSPTRNIQCLGSTSPRFVDCYLRRATWATARRPASCVDLEWVPNEIWVYGRKPGLGSCRGDIGPMCIPEYMTCHVLPYGTSMRIGLFTCTSRKTGMTCRRRDGRRQGFTVSRTRYKLFR